MKTSVGVRNLVAMKDHPRYVVASSTDNGPLTVWNVAKGKTSGRAVRIEHGLVDPTDIVVVRNTKAVILCKYTVQVRNDDSLSCHRCLKLSAGLLAHVMSGVHAVISDVCALKLMHTTHALSTMCLLVFYLLEKAISNIIISVSTSTMLSMVQYRFLKYM